MSTPGLINHYPFLSVMSPTYPITTNLTSSTNVMQFHTNVHPITMAGMSALPFLNSGDLATHMMSPMAYSFVNEQDQINADNVLAIRIIMSGKEVGSIIGKRGDNIKKFREESMARINISDGNSPERIVTISGSCDQIHRAVALMCTKLEEDTVKITEPQLSETNQSVLSLRLLIQPVQYTGIIGNGGGRMTQLSEMTGATILFGVDFLPNSSERLLTISGSSQSISFCILELCKILVEIPMPCNTYVVPYSPKALNYPGVPQTMAANGCNQLTSPTFGDNIPLPQTSLPLLPIQNIYPQSFYSDQMPYPFGLPMPLIPLKIPNTLSPYLQKPVYDTNWKQTPPNSGVLQQPNVSREFFVENEMIGCIIGRGGSTINEIRAISGAQIKISNCEDGKQERRININGTFDSVQTAQLLINSSLELYKQSVKIKAASNSNAPIILTNQLLPSNMPLSSAIPQNFLPYTQSPFFAFNSQLKPDLNISLLNSDRSQYESDLLMSALSTASADSDSVDRYVSKMKSTQIHLDGTKNIAVMKFKPY